MFIGAQNVGVDLAAGQDQRIIGGNINV